MALNISEHAAAYGLFQLAFAGLDTRLSRSLVTLLRSANPNLAFTIVGELQFGKRLHLLRKAIGTFKQDSNLRQEVYELGDACARAEAVSKWRNQRIHGEVRFIESQAVMIDGKGGLLQIDYDLCERQIDDDIHAAVAMEAHIPHLVGRLAFNEKLERVFTQFDAETE